MSVYGIETDNFFKGYYLSGRPNQVVYAYGTATVSRKPTWGFSPKLVYSPLTFLPIKVSLTKLFSFDMVMSKDDPLSPHWNEEEGLFAANCLFVAGAKSGNPVSYVGGKLWSDSVQGHLNSNGGSVIPTWHETSTTLDIWTLVSSATEDSWRTATEDTVMTDTVYVMLVGELPANKFQEIPEYGINIYGSDGRVTFNSNYMPANPVGFIDAPTGPASFTSTPAFKDSGLGAIGTLMSSCMWSRISTGSVSSRNFRCNMGYGFSPDGMRFGLRPNGFAGSVPGATGYDYYAADSMRKNPIYLASDYF